MPGKPVRMGLPKRRLLKPAPLERVALGVGLAGTYALLSLAASILLPGLQPLVGLYAAGAALLLSWWLHRYHSEARAAWARVASAVLLAVAAARPLAAALGVPEAYAALVDRLLLLTAALALHRLARGAPPPLGDALDRAGGLAFLAAFATLIPLPLVQALALAVASASLIRGYVLLAALARAAS